MYDLEEDEEENAELNMELERREALQRIFFQNLFRDKAGRAWLRQLLKISKAFTPADNPFPIDAPQLGLFLAREAGIRHVGGHIYVTL